MTLKAFRGRCHHCGHDHDADPTLADLRAAPITQAVKVPLTEKEMDDLISASHFCVHYVRQPSDELCIRWYKLGLQDGERMHGIRKPSMLIPPPTLSEGERSHD